MPAALPPDALSSPSPALTPELRTLVRSAGRQRLSLADLEDVDESALQRAATLHGLVPQLYRSLAELPPRTAPDSVLRGLEEHQRTIVQRGLRLTATLLEVHRALTDAGLTALPYKGPTLSAQLYGDSALRDAVDLDILLPPEQVLAAVEIMGRLGFVPGREYRPAIRGQLLRYRAEIGLVRDEVLLELQWRLAPNYFSVKTDFDEIWERRGQIQLGDYDLPVLSVEDNLLVLCVHGAKHHWSTLKWLVDVDRLIRTHAALDWRATRVRAERLGVRRILATTLFLCAKLFATPLPSEIRDLAAHDRVVARIAAEVEGDLIAGTERSEAHHHRFQLALRERRRDRWRYMWRLLWQPTESEWDAIRLPRGLVWLYPVVRLGRVAGKARG